MDKFCTLLLCLFFINPVYAANAPVSAENTNQQYSQQYNQASQPIYNKPKPKVKIDVDGVIEKLNKVMNTVDSGVSLFNRIKN